MALSPSAISAIKVGGASVLGGSGITGTGLFIHNQIQKSNSETKGKTTATENKVVLNTVEQEILKDETKDWNVKAEDNLEVVTTATSVTASQTSTTYSWKCTITADGITSENKGKLEAYLKGKLNKESASSLGEEKKANRRKLVEACSKNKTKEEGNTVEATLKLVVTNPGDESGNPISTDVLGVKNS